MHINFDLLEKAVAYHGRSRLAAKSFMSDSHLRRIMERKQSFVRPATRHLLASAIGCKESDLFPCPYEDELKTMNSKKSQ